MTSAVLDASAVLALVRDEPGGDKVAAHVGRAAISAINLQEVVKELLVSGLQVDVVRELLAELRFDVRAHDTEAAFAAAALHDRTSQYSLGLGDRSCLALAMQLGVPAITADREWKKIVINKLEVDLIR